MDAVVHSALEEICCEAAKGLHLRDLWPKLSPYLASKGLPLCPNVKRAVWENLAEIPGLKLEAYGGVSSSNSTVDLIKCTVEECEKMNVKIVAPEGMRKSFLGIYEMEASESGLSDTQRIILERLAAARKNGIAQSELAKELRIAANNLFYQLKKLEIQGMIVRQPTVIRTKQASHNGEPKNDSIVSTNMLFLCRYAEHFGCQQRLEITKEDKLSMDREVADARTETGDDYGNEIAKDDVLVKDFLPQLKAICDKLEKVHGKVLVVSDIKRDLGYRGTSGHRLWRNVFHRLKEARVVEECFTMIKKKEVNCIRLLQSFSPSLFEPKLNGHGHDDIETEQSTNLLKRGQITEQLVEIPVLRQVYDMIDAAGSKGLTNTEVCRRLGLCSKEYHKRYFKQMISRFGLHLQLESHHRVMQEVDEKERETVVQEVNGKERNTVMQEVNESNSLVPNFHENLSQPLQVLDTSIPVGKQDNLSQPLQSLDTSITVGNISGINHSENDAAVITEGSNGKTMHDESSSTVLLQCNPKSSDVEVCNEAPDSAVLQDSKLVTNCNMLVPRSSDAVPPTRRRSYLRYPRLTVGAISSQREQHILKMLQEEKFLIKPELHRRLESLEKERNTMMDRKTLERSLNKLQQDGHCKCIHVSVPIVTNCGRNRTTEVVLHPSVYSVPPELLTQIHDKMRSFEIQVRKQSYTRQKKVESAQILENVQRIPSRAKLDVQLESDESLRANGVVLAKMVRAKLLHTFLWGWICNSPGWDDALSSGNHSYDVKNLHSSCKLFELDLAIRSMPLDLFLQVVGSPQKTEDVVEKRRTGLLLCDLSLEEYKAVTDTRATGRLSCLIDILRRLKLIRLVREGHAEDGASSAHAILTNALELKPYIEEPVSTVAPSGSVFSHLRPQVRHDFVLSSRKGVDEYWNTLEYCYAAAKPRAALLAFPGSVAHEVFHSRSWSSASVMTAEHRTELLKRVTEDDRKKRLSLSECVKIAEDLNLTLEQVLRVYYDRQRRMTRFKRVLDAEGKELQTVKGKHIASSRKRKRNPDRMSSKLVKASVADSDNQFSVEQHSWLTASEDYDYQLQRYYLGYDKGAELLKEDDEVHHKQALSRLKSARQKKFLWTEEADRQLVIEYARHRAALGAKYQGVDWASLQNLPAPLQSCKRRMASLKRYIPFRKALMKLCNMLAERYRQYLEKFQSKTLNPGDPRKMVRDTASEKDSFCSSAPMSENWANFDDSVIKVALDNVLRYKKMAKLDTVQDTSSDHEDIEDDVFEGFDGKVSGQRSSAQHLSRKYMKLLSKGASVGKWMHESVAIANAAELFKLIFLSNSMAPEVSTFLAETLRRYSEHDLFAAFNYLREKKIMIGGSSNSPFALSQPFLQSISSSKFPTDTGERAAKFSSWLHEKQKDLMEEGIDVPLDMQCGEVFTLCTLVYSGEVSITSCLPSEGVGEAEDYRTSKRKWDGSVSDCAENSKKSKTPFTGEGELIARREKGFPGITLCLHREKLPRGLAIDSFKDEDMYTTPPFGGNDQNNTLSGLDDQYGSSDCVGEILDSGKTINPASDVSESPWEAMTTYAEYLMSSCACEVKNPFQSGLFKTLYSAIQKSGDNGLSMNDIRKVLNIDDEKMLEVIIEVLGAFGRALKVNAYDSIHIVDSLYRSKYFLTSVSDRAGDLRKSQHIKIEDENVPLNNTDNHGETNAASENEINMHSHEVHRVTILNLREDVADPVPEILAKYKITGYQKSEAAPPKTSRIENSEFYSASPLICRPLLPWMNGDGVVNELVYKGLVRRVLSIVMQNPGILEDGIIKQMSGLNPQSCRQLLEIMIMDNHIIPRKMHQMTSGQRPSILGNLLGNKFRKPKSILRVHYFANSTSTHLL
ncbi:hypothetical protein ABFS82_09G122300 [Erythranthe guttata]